jgi:hypothetical protein
MQTNPAVDRVRCGGMCERLKQAVLLLTRAIVRRIEVRRLHLFEFLLILRLRSGFYSCPFKQGRASRSRGSTRVSN